MVYEVTIGIPVYNVKGYIESTMESALNQTYPDIEYLVIDDCSGDGSIDVVELLHEKHPRGKDIRILYNDENLGVGITRNRILDEARGKYLYILDRYQGNGFLYHPVPMHPPALKNSLGHVSLPYKSPSPH